MLHEVCLRVKSAACKQSIITTPRRKLELAFYFWRELAKNYSNVVEKKPERLGFNMK